jgi:hypothetical protein
MQPGLDGCKGLQGSNTGEVRVAADFTAATRAVPMMTLLFQFLGYLLYVLDGNPGNLSNTFQTD